MITGKEMKDFIEKCCCISAKEREKEAFEEILKDGKIEQGTLIANPVHKEELEKFGKQILFSSAADVNKIYVVLDRDLKKRIKEQFNVGGQAE